MKPTGGSIVAEVAMLVDARPLLYPFHSIRKRVRKGRARVTLMERGGYPKRCPPRFRSAYPTEGAFPDLAFRECLRLHDAPSPATRVVPTIKRVVGSGTSAGV